LCQDHLASSHSELIPRIWISYFQNDPAGSNPPVANVFAVHFCLFVCYYYSSERLSAGWTDDKCLFDSLQGQGIFLSCKAFRPAWSSPRTSL